MSKRNDFQVGDIVVSNYGKKPLKITDTYSTYCYAKYLHSNQSKQLYYGDIKHYEDETMTTANTLFQIKLEDGTVTYGTHVGTNSSNQFLIEEKGTGKIILANKSQLEEVLPYTFSVRMNGKNVHFQGEPDTVKKGDILLYTGEGADNAQIAYVTGIDTKNKAANKAFKGRKVVTEEI
jgi:hypothetical protein